MKQQSPQNCYDVQLSALMWMFAYDSALSLQGDLKAFTE